MMSSQGAALILVQSLSYNPVYILMYLKFLNGFM